MAEDKDRLMDWDRDEALLEGISQKLIHDLDELNTWLELAIVTYFKPFSEREEIIGVPKGI